MKWFYIGDDKQVRPSTEKDLGRLIKAGILTESSLVRREDSRDWIRLIESGLVEVKTEAPQKAQAASMLTTIMQKARTNSLRIMFVAGGLFVVGILAVTVWPTLYRYDRVTEDGDTNPIRTHRLSGKTERLYSRVGWVDISSSSPYAPTPVPQKELEKIEGEMDISDKRILVETYNGTSRALSSIRVEVIIFRKAKEALESGWKPSAKTPSPNWNWKCANLAVSPSPTYPTINTRIAEGWPTDLRRTYNLTSKTGERGSPLSSTSFETPCGFALEDRQICFWRIVSATWQ